MFDIKEIEYKLLTAEQKRYVLRWNFEIAVRYAEVEIEGLTFEEWIEKEFNELAFGYDSVPFVLNEKEHLKFQRVESSNTLQEIVETYLEKEEEEENIRMLIGTLEKIKLITHAIPGERNFYIDMVDCKPSIFGGDEFELSYHLEEDQLRQRIKLMLELHQMDSDLVKINEEEIKLRTMFQREEEACFELDYALEKYFCKKEKEFVDFLAYISTKSREKENHINDAFEKYNVLNNIKENLEKMGKVMMTKRNKIILLSPESYERKNMENRLFGQIPDIPT